MSASSLSELLASQLPATLRARAQALIQLQDQVDRSLPAALSGHVRVLQLAEGQLRLACDSGAVASRLRHLSERLVADLSARGVAVTSLRVSVNPELLATALPPLVKPGLPAAALDSLAQLGKDIDEGPLKQALGRLLRHHRQSGED